MVEKSNLSKPVQGVGMIKAESIKQNLKNEASITFVKKPFLLSELENVGCNEQMYSWSPSVKHK